MVVGDAVPDIEEESAARPQHAKRLTVALDLVGQEHHAELTGDDVECRILEWQRQCICLLPCDPAPKQRLRCGVVQHGLIEVGCDDPGLCWETGYDRGCEHA